MDFISSAGAGSRSNRDKLSRMLDQFREVERTAAGRGLSFVEAMRLLAGANISGDRADR